MPSKVTLDSFEPQFSEVFLDYAKRCEMLQDPPPLAVTIEFRAATELRVRWHRYKTLLADEAKRTGDYFTSEAAKAAARWAFKIEMKSDGSSRPNRMMGETNRSPCVCSFFRKGARGTYDEVGALFDAAAKKALGPTDEI
jgi:hypothetical protein